MQQSNTDDKILLPNRDGDRNYLVNIGEDEYLLSLEHPEYGVTVTGEKDNIIAIDTSGGDMICIEGRIYDLVVEKIEYRENFGFVIKLRKK